MTLTLAAQTLVSSLASSNFSEPIHTTYNPLEYAWDNHQQYLKRYGEGKKEVLFLGMNPGPWGMSQTGIPFGEVSFVKEWMKLDGSIKKPDAEHPKRPIEGLSCGRSEVSGRRLWGYFSGLYPEAELFFRNNFVLNYCPLMWMSETGANVTPDKIAKSEMLSVEEACMEHLKTVISLQKPRYLIGIGAFAEKRLLKAQKSLNLPNVVVGRILHPSPASPAANKGWAEAVEKQLEVLNIKL